MSRSTSKLRPESVVENRVLPDIVIWHEHQGWSPNKIVSYFPQLTFAAVSAALSYYRKHSEEIEADIRHAEEVEAEVRERHPSRLKGKMEAEPCEVLS